jgi:hypothetical protein
MNKWNKDSSIVACYEFNDGALTFDRSLKGNHLTNVGVVYDNGAKFVRAEGDYLYRAHTSLGVGFPGTTGNTDIAIWADVSLASLPGVGEGYVIASKYSDDDGDAPWILYWVNVAGTYSLLFAKNYSGSWESVTIYSSAVDVPSSHKIGISFNGTSKAYVGELYDSAGVGYGSVSGNTTYGMAVDDEAFMVGAYPSTGGPVSCLDGAIRSLVVANTTKTSTDFDAMAAGTYLEEAVATYGVFVDWNNDNDFADANEDISAYVLSIPSFSAGRNSDTDYDYAGTCTVKLKNGDSFFSPNNSGSAIYGNVLPNRRVRITMTHGGTTVTAWQGFLQDISCATGQTVAANTATLRANGPLGQLSEGTIDVARQTTKLSSEIATAILDAKGWPAGDRSIGTGLTTIAEWTDSGYSPLSSLREMQDMEFGRLREGKAGQIVFDSRDAIFASPHDVAQATYGTGGFSVRNVKQLDSRSSVYNHVSAKCKPFNYTDEIALVTVCDINAGKGGNPPYVAGSAATAYYASLPAGSPFESVAEWSSTAYTANSAADGSGTDLTADVSIAITNFGRQALLTITNASATAAYLTRLILYGKAWAQDDAIEVRSSDATSIAAYGRREYPRIGKYHTSTTYTKQHADYAVALYKSQRPPVSFEVPSNLDASYMADAMARETGDRIHLNFGADYGLFIDGDYIIDQIAHSVPSPYNHVMTITCTPAPTAELAATGEAYTPKIVPYSRQNNPASNYDSSSADTGNPTGASDLQILTNDDDPTIPRGSMAFRFNRDTSNYRSIWHVQVTLGASSPFYGPYAAQRTAHADMVIADSASPIQIVAGQLLYFIASGTPDDYAGKVLLIYKTGDAGLAGNMIGIDSGSAITITSAFNVSGLFNYSIVKPWWNLNEWDRGFYFPADFKTQNINEAVWQTKDVPIYPGIDLYAQAFSQNRFGVSI